MRALWEHRKNSAGKTSPQPGSSAGEGVKILQVLTSVLSSVSSFKLWNTPNRLGQILRLMAVYRIKPREVVVLAAILAYVILLYHMC